MANLVVGMLEADLVYVVDGHLDRVANLVVGSAERDIDQVANLVVAKAEGDLVYDSDFV